MIIALDVGEKRIGIASGNAHIRIANPQVTLANPGSFVDDIVALVNEDNAEIIVVGLPRNMEGEETKQTGAVRDFVDRLKKSLDLQIVFQDESLTSVEAERRLKQRGNDYAKADIDKEAAAIILQDYLDRGVKSL